MSLLYCLNYFGVFSKRENEPAPQPDTPMISVILDEETVDNSDLDESVQPVSVFCSPERQKSALQTIIDIACLESAFATLLMYGNNGDNFAKVLGASRVGIPIYLFFLLVLDGHFYICERSIAKIINQVADSCVVEHLPEAIERLLKDYPVPGGKREDEKNAAVRKMVLDAISMMSSTGVAIFSDSLWNVWQVVGTSLGLFGLALLVRTIIFVSNKECHPDQNHGLWFYLKRLAASVLSLSYACMASFNYAGVHIFDADKDTTFWAILAGVIFCSEVARSLPVILNTFKTFIPNPVWNFFVYLFGPAGTAAKTCCQTQNMIDLTKAALVKLFDLKSDVAEKLATVIVTAGFSLSIGITQFGLNTAPRHPQEISAELPPDEETPLRSDNNSDDGMLWSCLNCFSG